MKRIGLLNRTPSVAAAVAVGAFLMVSTIVFAIKVIEDHRELHTAAADNVQWALAQIEVEFQDLKAALQTAPGQHQVDLNQLRQEFNIFFSRVETLRVSSIYQPLRETVQFEINRRILQNFVDKTAAVIDASADALNAALPDLWLELDDMQGVVRRLARSGLLFFAETEARRRIEISDTLSKLAAFVGLLLIVLGCLAVFLARLNASNLRRSREIEHASERLNTVIQTSLDAVIITDSLGLILEINPAAELIFGYTPQDVIGQNLANFFVQDDLRKGYKPAQTVFFPRSSRRNVGQGRVQLNAYRKSGEVFPVELSLQTAKTYDVTIFIAFLRDVSERVSAERALVKARDRALADEKMKSDFIAVMSHEIRTPLNGLLGNLSLLRDTALDKQQQDYLNNMETSGRLLMTHVDDVLDLSKYDAGKLVLNPKPMNLGVLVQDIIDTQTGRAIANNSVIDWGWIGAPVDWIDADAGCIQNVLMNLVSNAVKFTKSGRISIELEAMAGDADDLLIEFRVSDTGIGMDPALMARVFEDFLAGNTDYDREIGGTGLGLGIVKRFTQALGGECGVESEVGQGSRFWVRIPVVPVPHGASPDETACTTHSIAPSDVLVVEDNEINRIVAQDMLRAAGHHVILACNGDEAITLAYEKRFDLILMDISMPVMDGPTACQTIRNGRGASRDVPIYALTASAMAEERRVFLAAGMNGILTKPLSRTALNDTLAGLAGYTEADPASPALLSADQLSEMRDTLGTSVTSGLADRFIKEAEWLLDWLEDGNDLPADEVASRVHNVSGSAAVFGASAFRTVLLDIEGLAKQNRVSQIAERLPELSDRWRMTSDLLRKKLAA